MIMTASGTLIRMSMEDIKSMKRDTMGVKLINTRDDDIVSTVTRVDKSEDEENTEETPVEAEQETSEQSDEQ